MQAIVYRQYGSTDVLDLKDTDKPGIEDNELLVRVRAASLNPYDWHLMTGLPMFARLSFGLRRPKANGLGADLAGVVEAVGGKVTAFRPDDEVFGEFHEARGDPLQRDVVGDGKVVDQRQRHQHIGGVALE